MVASTHWTDEEVVYLKLNWKRLPTRDIAAHLGKTSKSVVNKAKRLGLGGGGASPVWNMGLQNPRGRMTEAPEPTIADLVRAREDMKKRPGPMRLGFRISARSFR